MAARAARVCEGDLDPDDLQELRVALVMTGGVSLAVWMGGVTHELDRLVRAENPTYLALLRLTRTVARVDVISGTSAGGLNGALLATGLVRDAPVSGLRDLWLKLGALARLLRPALAPDPPSLMRGDDYFGPQIKEAIEGLEGPGTDPVAVPMELIITTTLLNGWPRGISDSFGTVVHDAEHRGQFTFRRDADGDQFAIPDISARLALAARSTASFPFAFEASYVPSGEHASEIEDRPDMQEHANFRRNRYVVDGGVLVNKPLRPALKAVFRQPAAQQVRRVLAYVVPDPGEARTLDDDPQKDAPKLTDVGLASLMRLPRNQSVLAELDELVEHNARVEAQRRQRRLVLTDLDVDDIAQRAYRQYRLMRADRMSGWLLQLLARGLAALALQDRAAVEKDRFLTEAPLAERAELRRELTRCLQSLPPEAFPTPTEPVAEWFTTVDTVERAASLLLDLQRRALGLTDPTDPASATARAALRDLRRRVSEQLTLAQSSRSPLGADQQLALARDAVTHLRSDTLATWTDDNVPRLLGDPSLLAERMEALADLVHPTATAVVAACEHARAGAARDEVLADAGGLVRDVEPTRASALRRLLCLEVTQIALGGEPTIDQRIEFIQVSGDAGNGLDQREHADEKLAGIQLGHFGAFYKRSWRANDWMWGRHDAAQRLAQVALDPARLRQLRLSRATVLAHVEDLAFGNLSPADAATLRAAGPRRWDERIAAEELAFLDDEQQPLPAVLPMCAQAIARRLQLDVLREELPTVADSMQADIDAGASASDAARAFLAAFERAEQPLSAADAIELLHACEVGAERIEEETGSDLLARTATHAVAVGTAAVGGKQGGAPKVLGPVLRSARGAGLAMHQFVRYALEGSRIGVMVATGALFAGAALVAVGLLADIPGILTVLGVGGVLLAVGLAFWRGHALGAVFALIAGFLVAAAPFVVQVVSKDDDVDRWADRVDSIFVVGGLLLAAGLLSRLAVREPSSPGSPSTAAPR